MTALPSIEACLWRGLPAWRMRAADGAEVTVLERGAQVVSWQTPDGRERLYVSPQAQLAEGAPIRGGVPVCFPQFAGRGPLPQHGIVRTRPWQIDFGAIDKGRLSLRITEDAQTLQLWPHAFALQIEVTASAGGLRIAFTAHNPGPASFTFMAALHTYLQVEALPACKLEGLPAGALFDNSEKVWRNFAGGVLDLSQPLDQVHAGVQGPLRLVEGKQDLSIVHSGFQDVVVWNPGAERARAITDLPDDDWSRFICVEAALIEAPHTLAPGDHWSGFQALAING